MTVPVMMTYNEKVSRQLLLDSASNLFLSSKFNTVIEITEILYLTPLSIPVLNFLNLSPYFI